MVRIIPHLYRSICRRQLRNLLESIQKFYSSQFCSNASLTSFSANNGPGVNRVYWGVLLCLFIRIAAPLAFFATLLGNLSERLLPVYQKHCRLHREFYCCLCCWRFRRYTLWISANICVGHVRYCYLFNVVYFLICTLKNCKNKRIQPFYIPSEFNSSVFATIACWYSTELYD